MSIAKGTIFCKNKPESFQPYNCEPSISIFRKEKYYFNEEQFRSKCVSFDIIVIKRNGIMNFS